MRKVSFKTLKSVTTETDNSTVSDRKYDITACVTVADERVGRIECGKVRDKEGREVASFGAYANGGQVPLSVSISFQSQDEAGMAEIMSAVNQFAADVIDEVAAAGLPLDSLSF